MTSTTPRLVHVTTTDVSLDWLLSPQLAAFREEGFEVTAVSAPGPHVDAIEELGIRHVPIRDFTRRMDPFADMRAARELHGVLGELEPHILHTHNPKPGVIGRIVGRRRGVPVVVNTVHGLYAQPTDRRTRKTAVYAAEAVAMRFSDIELVQNIEDLRTLRQLGAPREKLIHLGNGIDLSRFNRSTGSRARGLRWRRSIGIAPDAVVVGIVARLVYEKGYREFFAAVDDLRRAGYDTAEFVVVGPMEDGKADVVDDAMIHGAKANGVHFLGQQDSLEDLYPAFDIFVLPSHREGFPRAAMEASAMGIPIIATDIRGCRQVVSDGFTGTLVPVGDSRALARAIAQLIDSPGTRHAMSIAATRRAKLRFDQNKVIDLTLGVYRNQLRAAGFVGPQPEPIINLRYADSISLVDTPASKRAAAETAA
jgi:glycosyltransferase involved in cell wall biosynthesis